MYKCGWNGCEKAYGTLNHLNAHVTMQGHGTKRTPEGMWFLRMRLAFCHVASYPTAWLSCFGATLNYKLHPCLCLVQH